VEVQPGACQWCWSRYVDRIYAKHGKLCVTCLHFVRSRGRGGRGTCTRTKKAKDKKVNQTCLRWARWAYERKVDQC
jgi:hypothetical protein